MYIIFPKNINTSKDFNARVMNRVFWVYYLKKVASPVFLGCCGIVILAVAGTTFFSLKMVITNSPAITDLKNTFFFWIDAYLGSEIQLKLIIVAIILMGETLVFNVAKDFVNIRTRGEGLKKLFKFTKRMAAATGAIPIKSFRIRA